MTITKDFITVNQYSRSGYKRPDTVAVVLHWVENAGQSAKSVRNYFESLKVGIIQDGKVRYASSQYIVGLEGEIIQTMPEEEVSYNCGAGGKVDPVSGKLYTDLARNLFPAKYTSDSRYSPSYATIAIEMCHPNWDGKFNSETLEATSELVTDIFKRNSSTLTDVQKQIVTHHSIVGWKFCPKWFVNHPEDFQKFKDNIDQKLKI